MTSRQTRSKSGDGWPADKVKRRKVADLVPYARNARTHSEEQVAQIAASIREWGWTNPVLVDEDDGIIAGHGRILAAQMLGLKYVPCMVAAGWTEAQKRAYVIADNKLALNAGWDLDMLSAEFGALAEANFDLSLTGFGELELADLMAGSEPEGGDAGGGGERASLADRFGFVPFSVFSARDGAWQERKAAWVALGIRSEEGRGAPIGGAPMPLDRRGNAAPGNAPMPAADYGKSKARGDGRGRAVNG